MNWVDWCLLAVMAASIVVGLWRGFTREVLGIGTWILALAAALLLGPMAADTLESRLAEPAIRMAAGYGAVFFGGLVVGAIITAIVSALVRESPLSGVDRTIGGGFGLLRGVFVAVIFVWLTGLTPVRDDGWWQDSVFIGQLEGLAESMHALMPDDWRHRLESPPATAVRGA